MSSCKQKFTCDFGILTALFFIVAAQFIVATPCGAAEQTATDTRPVSIFIVRHAETDLTQPTWPLSPAGQQRAQLLTQTLRGVKFTHLFSSHTTRSRQMLEGIAANSGLPIVQLPTPGSMLDGQPVTEQTSRRAPIEPIAAALLNLPPGSVALVALNSENIYAILNKLGVPVADNGASCAAGSLCVPCTNNSCYPLLEFDHLWHVLRAPGVEKPLEFVELHYAAGWHPQ